MKYITIITSTNISILKHPVYIVNWLPTQAHIQRYSWVSCVRTYFMRSIYVLQPNIHIISRSF